MPDQFVVFPPQNRDANTEYSSGAYTVPVDAPDIMVKFTLSALDMINEPETTIIYWRIERNDGSGWTTMISIGFVGLNGVIPPKPYGFLATNIDNVRGQDVRGIVSFESAGDQKKRWGVSGELY